MRFWIISFLLLVATFGDAQNIILNGDFELYYSCPEALYQDSLVHNWSSVVHSADYYNCGQFSTSGVYGSNSR